VPGGRRANAETFIRLVEASPSVVNIPYEVDRPRLAIVFSPIETGVRSSR